MSWSDDNLVPESRALYASTMSEIHERLTALYPAAEEVVITIHERGGNTWVLRNCPLGEATRVARFGLESLEGSEDD